MNFRTLVNKVDFDKLLVIVVTIGILLYLLVSLFKTFNLNENINKLKELTNELSMSEIYDYLDKHDNYYYKIENAVYCITKEDLLESGEISSNFLGSMKGTIEATYKSNSFTLKYNDDCISS